MSDGGEQREEETQKCPKMGATVTQFFYFLFFLQGRGGYPKLAHDMSETNHGKDPSIEFGAKTRDLGEPTSQRDKRTERERTLQVPVLRHQTL